MSYNSARNELFLADCKSNVVRAMLVPDNPLFLSDSKNMSKNPYTCAM